MVRQGHDFASQNQRMFGQHCNIHMQPIRNPVRLRANSSSNIVILVLAITLSVRAQNSRLLAMLLCTSGQQQQRYHPTENVPQNPKLSRPGTKEFDPAPLLSPTRSTNLLFYIARDSTRHNMSSRTLRVRARCVPAATVSRSSLSCTAVKVHL